MTGRWICKECGGEFRGVKMAEVSKEYTLDEDGNLMELIRSEEVDSDFEKYYCTGCDKEVYYSSELEEVAEWKWTK